MPKLLPYGEWLPDLPDFQNPGSTVATNVIPALKSYRPFKGLNVFTDSLDSRVSGAISVQNEAGTVITYAGDTNSLYRLNTTSFTDISRSGSASTAYSVPTLEQWELTQFGRTLVAVNEQDHVQGTTISSSGSFSDLITSNIKPKARHVAVVRNFLVLGNVTDESASGSGTTSRPQRVRWSALEDATDFDPSAATQAGFQDLFSEGGPIQKVVGGEEGMIFQERSIWKMTYIGTPLIFQFDEIMVNRGTISPGSVIRYGTWVYFLAEDGFYRISVGGQVEPIGRNKINDTFFADFDIFNRLRIISAIDPANSLVAWAYPGKQAQDGQPNKILFYNWETKRWAVAKQTVDYIFRSLSQSSTLDQLDNISTSLDNLEFSLDSRAWLGGVSNFAGFDADRRLGYFDGAPLDAVLETGEFQPNQEGRSVVTRVRPVVDGLSSTSSVQLGVRDEHQDTVSFGAKVSLNIIGEAPTRVNGRYFRVRTTITGNYDHAQGVMISYAAPVGRR